MAGELVPGGFRATASLADVSAPLLLTFENFFDTLDGRYAIEPLADGRVLLHLSSEHRLSTRFNFYAGWWTDWIMRDTQNYILAVVKARCESVTGRAT